MTNKSHLGKNDPAAQRVRLLRLAVAPGLSSKAFATTYGFTPQQWNNYENGHPIPRDAAIKLCDQIPGLAPGWLWDGDIDSLSVHLSRKLQEAATGVRRAITTAS